MFDFATDKANSESRFGFDPNTGARLNKLYSLVRDGSLSAFVQDDWKLAPNLTLSLGFRYEDFFNPSDGVGEPYLAQAHASLAQALQRAGQKEESQKQLAELETLNQGTANVGRAMILVETAEGHMKHGQQSTAVGELQEAVTLSPDFTEAHYQLGSALARSPNGFAKAEAAFRQVLQLNPNHAPAHFQLEILLAARGDKALASTEFQEAVQLAPGLTEAHRALAQLAVGSHDWPTAVQEFQAVVAWNWRTQPRTMIWPTL